MATVNPIEASLGRLPSINDPRYKHQLELILRQLTDYTGADTQLITSIITRETYPWPQQTPQSADDTLLYGYTAPVVLREFTAITANSSYTASDWDWVNAKRGSTITFPELPAEGAEVIVRVGDTTQIPIDGNGRLINGSSTGILRGFTRSIRFKYFIDDNEWFAL